MQELADQLDVAPPTVTAMVKQLLAQGICRLLSLRKQGIVLSQKAMSVRLAEVI